MIGAVAEVVGAVAEIPSVSNNVSCGGGGEQKRHAGTHLPADVNTGNGGIFSIREGYGGTARNRHAHVHGHCVFPGCQCRYGNTGRSVGAREGGRKPRPLNDDSAGGHGKAITISGGVLYNKMTVAVVFDL